MRNIQKIVGKLPQFLTSWSQIYASVAKKVVSKPPVPDLSGTLSKYLGYARVLSTAEQYAKTESFVQKFEQNEGPEIQKKVEQIAEEETNWANKFWLPDMYLNQRFALPVNSNPGYVFPRKQFENLDDQLNYTACLIRGICSFKEKVDSRNLSQDMSTGREKVPLCMEQYYRLFTSYREPSYPSDILHTNTHEMLGQNEHVVVMCNNQAFAVRTKLCGESLSQVEIWYQLQHVYEMAHNRCEVSVLPVGLITSAQRDKAATAMQYLMENASNRLVFDWFRQSSFIVCLDKGTIPEICMGKEEQWAHEASQLLHGMSTSLNACNRWYDKTYQLIVADDGLNGLNIEHSVAEGIVIISLVEHALRYVQEEYPKKQIAVPTKRLKPKPLSWYIPEPVRILLEEMKEDKEKMCKDLDFKVLIFEDFGKGFIKSQKMSPDAFIQLTLQLAFYRIHGHLVSSYESASVRRFKQGRVDNIRSATPECFEWVKTMENPQASMEDKKTAFQTALKRQTKVMIENITGYGIDNHMVALRDVAAEQGVKPEIFVDPIFEEAFRFPLTTSQVGTSVDDTFLGYGAVTPDGYGCAYNPGENRIDFAIASYYSCPKTDSQKYKDSLKKTLLDMKSFLENNF